MRFQSVRQQLALQIPKELPCRENEISKIYNRLSSSVKEDTSLTMYIAGQPGTGKTACVLKALNMITDEWQRNSYPPFHLCYVNAMSLTSPKEIYHQVWKVIAPTKGSAKKLLKQEIPKKVADFFCHRPKNKNKSTGRNMYTVIIIDELDFLLTRDQKIIYEFMDWPQKENSKLAVIGISNTVNLPEQLMDKIANRMHTTERMTFQPYRSDQIQLILRKRLEGTDVFDEKALTLVAHKTAAASGDIRRGLDLCRRAVELKEDLINVEEMTEGDQEQGNEEDAAPIIPVTPILSRKGYKRKRRSLTVGSEASQKRLETEKITSSDIQNALEGLEKTELYALEDLPIYHKLFLWCARAESMERMDSDQSDLKIENIISRIQTLLRKSDGTVAEVTLFEMLPVVYCLLSMNLFVQSSRSDKERYPMVELCISHDDIEKALVNDPEVKLFINI